MNQVDAERKARKLWGDRYAVAVQEWAQSHCRYAVGYVFAGMFCPQGQGPTWEDAFRAAAERKERLKGASS